MTEWYGLVMKRLVVILAVFLVGIYLVACTPKPPSNASFLATRHSQLFSPVPPTVPLPTATNRWPSSHTPQPSSQSGRQASASLLSTSGTGDAITDNFTLNEKCGKVVVDWTGKALGTVPFVNFRFKNVDGGSGGHSGIHDLDQVTSGKDGFSLKAGTYYIEVDTYNASWTVKVTCES